MEDEVNTTPSDLVIAGHIAEAAAVAVAAKIVAARANALRIERARRLVADAGDPDSAAGVAERLAHLDDRRSELRGRARAVLATPVIAGPRRAVIRGVVTDRDGAPVARLTVSAVIGEERYGSADTDATGAYAIVVTPRDIAGADTKAADKDKASEVKERIVLGRKDQPARAAVAPAITLWVSRGRDVILRDTAQIQPRAGATFVRDLVVERGKQ